VLKTIGNHTGVVNPGFLIKTLGWIVFADDNG